MANLPRFGRNSWQRFSSMPRPGTASRPPPLTTTLESEVLASAPATSNILQTSPFRERSSPVRKISSPPSSPKYRSPKPLLSPTPTYNRYDGERRSSAKSSPKTAYKPTHTASPPLSPPKNKYSTTTTIAAPLSPLTLPRSEVRHETHHTIRSRSPPQPQMEEKTTEYPKRTVEKAAKSEHRQKDDQYSSGGKAHQKNQQQSDVINIKGENVGAVMHITHSSNATQIHKKFPNTNYNENQEDDDHKSNKSTSSSSSTSNLPGKSFMNSNFQGVNNSILYNSSLTHRDPGLHLAFSKNNPAAHANDHHSTH